MAPKDKGIGSKPGNSGTADPPRSVNYPLLSTDETASISYEGLARTPDSHYSPLPPSRRRDSLSSHLVSPALLALNPTIRSTPSPAASSGRGHSPAIQYPDLVLSDSNAEYKSYLLVGEVALVTGAERGVGRAVAIELASRGALVVLGYTGSKSEADKVVEEISGLAPTGGGPPAVVVQADLRSVESVKMLFERAKSAFGRIDVVVSNAGQDHWGHISEITEEDMDGVFDCNFKSQLLVAQQAYRHLSEGGRLIMLSSCFSRARGNGSHSLYNASKAAIEALVRSLPVDFGERMITVNGIAPGIVKGDTNIQHARYSLPGSRQMTAEDIEAAHAERSPLKRVGLPSDVARVAAFLASGDGVWMNGQTLFVAGGHPGY